MARHTSMRASTVVHTFAALTLPASITSLLLGGLLLAQAMSPAVAQGAGEQWPNSSFSSSRQKSPNAGAGSPDAHNKGRDVDQYGRSPDVPIAGNAPLGGVERSELAPLELPPQDAGALNTNQDTTITGGTAEPLFGARQTAAVESDFANSGMQPRHGAASSHQLPAGVWRGLDWQAFEELTALLRLPMTSAAANDLLARLLTTPESDLAGVSDPAQFNVLRADMLSRGGFIAAADQLIGRLGSTDGGAASSAPTPGARVALARLALAKGDAEAACASARAVVLPGTGGGATTPQTSAAGGDNSSDASTAILIEAWAMTAYCAALYSAPSDAALIVALARERGLDAPEMFSFIETIANGETPRISADTQLGLVSWKLLSLLPDAAARVPMEQLNGLALISAATDEKLQPRARIAAAETAARQGLIETDALANAWRSEGAGSRLAGQFTQFAERIGNARPDQAARLIAEFYSAARAGGLGFPAAQILRDAVVTVPRDPQFAGFAETAADILIAARQPLQAAEWALFGSNLRQQAGAAVGSATLHHWVVLADILDAEAPGPRGASLPVLQDLAAAGAFAPETLHRLVTVLQALDYQVPIPLWETASRTPQPTDGYLPATGVLAQLKAAGEQRHVGATVLLALASLGPDGATSANLIALGDAIRALRAAGLEADARRLSVEALHPLWPRATR